MRVLQINAVYGSGSTGKMVEELHKYLKENGFTYKKDYFRDVRYSEFIVNYNGNMNCDYAIHIGFV